MNAKLVLASMTLLAVAILAGCESQPLQKANLSAGPAPTISADAKEVDLVEKMSEARRAYKAYLEAMLAYYIKDADFNKRVAAEQELHDLAKSRTYDYLLGQDFPAANLTKPKEQISEAETLYNDGLNYYEKGRVIGVPLAFSKEQMRLAREKFDTLIKQYPTSNRVADAFFYAAEIIKEYLRTGVNEDIQAVEYYKRAYVADPNLAHPAHFQRAVILDYRLHRRDEALEEYRNVLKFEMGKPFGGSKSNSDYAADRIRKLMEDTSK
jgi:tetratricopeptide (TPR) repeat protein